MKLLKIAGFFMTFGVSISSTAQITKTNDLKKSNNDSFDYVVEQFADIKVMRYQIPGWENLTLKEQKFVYYLTQAGYSGRDITYDQHYKSNLKIRKALENIYVKYKGNKASEDWKNFEIYLKRIWFASGIHHHYSNDKINLCFL